MFLALGTCAVMTGWMQRRLLAEFVDAEPLRFEQLEPDQAARDQAKAVVERIRQAAETGHEAEIPITVQDLNTWIATSPWLRDYRETARIRGITPQGVVAEMSQELRGGRFLNGIFRFTPARSETNTWQLMLEDIEVPGRTVPPAFIQTYRNLHMFRFDAGIPELQAVLKRIEQIRLEEGRLVVSIPEQPEVR